MPRGGPRRWGFRFVPLKPLSSHRSAGPAPKLAIPGSRAAASLIDRCVTHCGPATASPVSSLPDHDARSRTMGDTGWNNMRRVSSSACRPGRHRGEYGRQVRFGLPQHAAIPAIACCVTCGIQRGACCSTPNPSTAHKQHDGRPTRPHHASRNCRPIAVSNTRPTCRLGRPFQPGVLSGAPREPIVIPTGPVRPVDDAD